MNNQKFIIMKQIFIFLISLFCILPFSYAQDEKEIQLKGVVLDENNEPLIGANVVVKDVPGLGSITDIDGNFTLKMEPYHRILVSYIGYETQEILIKTQTQIKVVLKVAESSVLDEVVVTATGAMKKMSVTGAISAVNVTDLKAAASSNLTNALAGNVAGVIAMQTSGQPGKNTSEFWIRGISTFGASNSALVIVDGFERDMNDLNIEDIESFQVLKDASETAIYGARGANGVVLITTKRGKTGKINIDAKFETTYNTRTYTPEYVDGYTYATLMNEALFTRNQQPKYADDELFIMKHGLDPDLLPTVDWQDAVLKDGAWNYRASLNMNGGGSNARYYVSVNYLEEQGMYKTDKQFEKEYNTNANARRWNFRMNADIDLTKSTLVKIGIAGMLKQLNDAGKGSDAIWNSLAGQSPVSMPIRYSNGYFPATEISDIRDNPYVAATQTGYRQNWYNQMQTNVTLEQNFDFITKGLKFIGRFGFDTYNSNWINKVREPERYTIERFRDDNGELIFRRLNEEKKMTQSSGGTGDRRDFLELELHYNRNFGDHHINSTLKYNQDSKVQTYNLGSDLKNSIPYRHQGLAGRFTYDWNYKYYVNLNFGYTGSENFARESRFGFFPAMSVAWNIAEESFVKDNMEWLNMFKLRYSWGQVGNDVVGTRFPFLYTIKTDASGYNYADWGYSGQNYKGYTYSNVASNGVTWEVSTKHDVGVDLALFNDKFTLTADYFHETRSGIFMSRNELPWLVGLADNDNPKANVGKVLSKGVDGNFAFKQYFGDVLLTIRGNATYSYNEILEKDEGYKDYPYQYEKGYRVNQSKGLIALGLFKDWDDIRNSPQQTFGDYMPGDIKYKDVNGDGKIDWNDRVAIGTTSKPSLIYGVGASVNWKGLDVNVHFQGAGKSSVIISGSNTYPFSYGEWGNVLSDIMTSSRWISQDISGDPATENPNAEYPRLAFGEENWKNNSQASTYWMRDMSYLRLKTFEIGYTFPKTLVNKMKFNSIRIFAIGSNLLTFSKFKLWDPELNDNDGNSYPLTKSVTLGLSVNL